MGWDKGRYYTRSKKVDGRVVREYFGCGESAHVMALLDELDRQRRQRERKKEKQLIESLNEVDATISELCQRAELAARATLISAGYHQHDRGQWRKKRVRERSHCAAPGAEDTR